MTRAAELPRPQEAQRIEAVRRYDILDTPPDGCFDRITAIAAKLFSVPISIISLVDHDRIWFKSHHGLDVEQIDRASGLCASAILQDEPWILTDARADVRSLANPLVAGDFGLRFYVGVPLRTSDGFNLGTLCVIDREPRTVSEEQIEHLSNLASLVMDQMELRLSARRAVSELSQVVTEKDAALKRSAMLAMEIDHRVMNSLQLISGLLNVQSRAFGKSDAADQLTLAASRVSAIAQVHKHIYSNESADTTNCKAYLERMCAELSGMLLSDNPGEIIVQGVDAEVPTAWIVPIGLIVNELVTNASKHGGGQITVAVEKSASGGYSLSVSDDGAGLPPGFDPGSGRGLGMKVVSSLVQQLGGRLLFGGGEESRGSKFTVALPSLN